MDTLVSLEPLAIAEGFTTESTQVRSLPSVQSGVGHQGLGPGVALLTHTADVGPLVKV